MDIHVIAYFEYATKDKEFVDNCRYADLRNPEEVKKYLEAYWNGCCGFSDSVISGEDGHLFLVGFNYGH